MQIKVPEVRFGKSLGCLQEFESVCKRLQAFASVCKRYVHERVHSVQELPLVERLKLRNESFCRRRQNSHQDQLRARSSKLSKTMNT